MSHRSRGSFRIITDFVLILVLLSKVGLAQDPDQPRPHAVIGTLQENGLERMGLTLDDLQAEKPEHRIRYLGITRYLNDARAVVTATIDDSTRYVPRCVDALDKYGIKATIAVSTRRDPITELWPRLRDAVENGHEIGSHSRRHQCQWPDTREFCRRAYSQDEILGSNHDILANTQQPYVWSWVYPCGNCADYEFIHARLARAGYLVARNYPDERQGGNLVPNLRDWALDPYNAAYTQVVQKQGGIAPAGRTDLESLNRKFDEVYEAGGIYHFLSHPQWLDYGREQFFEQHLDYLGDRGDVWYVPLGPLYAYQVLSERTITARLESTKNERFVVYNQLDPRVYEGSITLRFEVPADARIQVISNRVPLKEFSGRLTDNWRAEYYRKEGSQLWVTVQPNTILELGLE